MIYLDEDILFTFTEVQFIYLPFVYIEKLTYNFLLMFVSVILMKVILALIKEALKGFTFFYFMDDF